MSDIIHTHVDHFPGAPCRLDPATWFPDNDHGHQARKHCAQCPYTGLWGPCADLGATEHYGVWAGMHPKTIRRLRDTQTGDAA